MGSVTVTGSTTIPCSADAGTEVVSGAGTDDGACLTLRVATADKRPAAAVADAVVVDAGAGAAFGAAIGFGRRAARSVRAAGLRAFACASKCRAASRVRQYPAA
jgi:hypothetical protein